MVLYLKTGYASDNLRNIIKETKLIISCKSDNTLFVVQFLYPPIDLFPINEKLRFHCS